MWVFLAQELLFFSGLFVAYGVYRSWYPEMFKAAAHQLEQGDGRDEHGRPPLLVADGGARGALRAGRQQEADRQPASSSRSAARACSSSIKFFEYKHKFEGGLLPGALLPPARRAPRRRARRRCRANTGSFFSIYFMMTGVHGVHVLVGIGVLIWIWLRNNRGDFSKEYFTPVDIVALYWHLVDLVWIYLFPLLYLI